MKTNWKDMVVRADAAKKVNPRDLSSDQDLTIGLMNLIAIENIAPGSQIADMIAGIRKKLMLRVVQKPALVDESYKMLAQAMKLMSDGMHAFPDQDKAYKCFDGAYVMYSMFWGLNMGFIKSDDVLANKGVDSNA